jgi:hypothetical protein
MATQAGSISPSHTRYEVADDQHPSLRRGDVVKLRSLPDEAGSVLLRCRDESLHAVFLPDIQRYVMLEEWVTRWQDYPKTQYSTHAPADCYTTARPLRP